MPGSLILPAVLLVCLIVAGGLVLREDTRQRRLASQLDLAIAAARVQTLPGAERRSIRIDAEARTRSAKILRLLGGNPATMRFWPPRLEIVAGLAGGGCTAWVAQLVMPRPLAFLAGLAAVIVVSRLLFAWQRQRQANILLRQMPDMIQMVVGAVRAGMPVSEAFRVVAVQMSAPTKLEFSRALDELGLGLPAHEVVMNIWRRTEVTEYAIFSMALAVQARSGGQLAETVQVLGYTLRERIGMAGRAKALAGEAIMSAQIVGSLPVLVAVAFSFIRPEYLSAMLHDGRGRVLIAYAITSWALGVLAMWWMIQRGTSV